MSDLYGDMRRLYHLLFAIALLAIVSVFTLDYLYDAICPTITDHQSGHVYPHFDKHHDRYVYLTLLEKDSLPLLLSIGVGSVFAGVFVSRKMRRNPIEHEPAKTSVTPENGSDPR
jgi:hypothetical protein